MKRPKRVRNYSKIRGLTPRAAGDVGLPTGYFDLARLPPTSPGPEAATLAAPAIAPETDTDATEAIDKAAIRGTKTALENPSLVSSANGKIVEMLVTISNSAVAGGGGDPSDQSETCALRAIYRRLFAEAKQADIRLVILTQEPAVDIVRKWLIAEGLDNFKLGVAPTYLGFTIWAQDGYASLQDKSDTTYLVKPFSFPRVADGEIPAHVAQLTDIQIFQVPLYYQGGNILTGDDFFLVGADYLVRSLRYITSDAIHAAGDDSRSQRYSDILRLFCQTLDTRRTLIPVGSSIPVPGESKSTITIDGQVWTQTTNWGNSRDVIPTVQPIFHIDMFLTLLGRPEPGAPYRIAVGDPRLAATILDHELPPFATPEVFDDIAEQLSECGFEIIRLPLPLIYFDDEDSLDRLWFYATANNALVQFDPADKGQNIVWMPRYGYEPWQELRATDEANQAIFEKLGFEVRSVGNCQVLAENLGSLHCIVKYLRRGR